MIPVGAEPMIVHAMRQCKAAGIEDIMINLHYFPQVVQDYLGTGEQLGVHLSFAIEEELLENAGAVINVRNFFGGEPFLAFASDNLTDIDLGALIAHHRTKGGIATIATALADDVTQYGIVECDEETRILSFQEKPLASEAKSNRIATCIYVFEPDIFKHLPRKPEKYHFGRQVFPKLLEQHLPLFAFHSTAYWNDIGNPDNYLLANFDALAERVKLAIPFEKTAPQQFMGKQTHMAPDAMIIPPVIIGNGCHIASGAVIGPFASIGNCSTIEDGAVISHSVLFDHNRIGTGAVVKNSILGRHCMIYPQNRIENLVLGEGSLVHKTSISNQVSLARGT